MDRLSSCYFCGVALDDPLQDYPLVAGDSDEPEAVVTLCPGCHRKLETVLGVVVSSGGTDGTPELDEVKQAALESKATEALTEPDADTVEGGEGDDPIALGGGEEEVDDAEAHEERDDVEAHEEVRGEVDAADVAAAASAAADDATTTDEGTAGGEDTGDESASGETVEAGADAAVAGETTDEGGDGEVASSMEPDVPDELTTNLEDDGDDETEREQVESAEEEDGDTETGDRPGDEGSPDVGADATPDPDGGPRDGVASSADEDPDGESGPETRTDAETTVSALEYNKVMRLLQNREFPVDREEIVTVAASAYDLSETECATVVDLAVDRGLIAEEDGNLVRPDE